MALHWKILIGLLSGTAFGIASVLLGMQEFTGDWIAPIGTTFINLLKLVAAPLIFSSMITGMASLGELANLTRIAGRTAILFLMTTIAAILIGLLLANIFRPGSLISSAASAELLAMYGAEVSEHSRATLGTERQGLLDILTNLVPENIFAAFSDNRQMLQVVFLSVLFGSALLLVRRESNGLLEGVIKEINDVILRIVRLAMLVAPIGVFALMAGAIVAFANGKLTNVVELISALGLYVLVVFLGLFAQVFVVYAGLIKVFTSVRLKMFLRGIAPAQLVAFSTNSSAATLPVSMECAEKRLGISPEVAAFVLPVGATINVDGTALYQAVAAVFIAQAFGISLDLSAQLSIIVVAVMASIGSAPVPGGGLVMMIVVLEAIGVPSAGLALILGVDRVMDMGRTVVNVTGDCTVSLILNRMELNRSQCAEGISD